MQVVSAIAFCTMLGAIFWRASTMSAATDLPAHTLADDSASQPRSAWQTRPKSLAEILMRPRSHSVDGGQQAQR
jgi:hypothetical protein